MPFIMLNIKEVFTQVFLTKNGKLFTFGDLKCKLMKTTLLSFKKHKFVKMKCKKFKNHL